MWNLINEHYRHAEFCGDPPAATPMETTGEMMQAYIQYLPDLLRATSGQIQPTGEAQLAAQEVLAPREAALQTSLYEQYGPLINAVGQKIAASNAAAQSASDLNILNTTGKQVVGAAREAQQVADPEYFKAREGALNQLGRLFNSLDDPNSGLTGAETAEIERAQNRASMQSGLSNPTAINNMQRLAQFGQAGEARKQQKQAAIAGAVGTATQFLPASKSGIDTFQMTTGKPSMPNTGDSRLGGISQAGNQAFDMGSQMWEGLGQQAQTQAQINSQRRNGMDMATQIMGSMPSVNCCFIFLESMNGRLPWWVRRCRDAAMTPQRRAGYVRMSRWLVPLMRRSKFVKNLVNEFMVKPLTIYGGYLCSMPGYEHGKIYYGRNHFWFRVWDFLGRKATSY